MHGREEMFVKFISHILIIRQQGRSRYTHKRLLEIVNKVQSQQT